MKLKNQEFDLNLQITFASNGVILLLPAFVAPDSTFGIQLHEEIRYQTVLSSDKKDVLAAIKKTLDTFYD